MADFIFENLVLANDKLLKLETDLDGDGKKEVFLSLSHNVNGRAGNIWTAYVQNRDGMYTKSYEDDAGDAICFRKDYYRIGLLSGLSGKVLEAYWPDARQGTLVAYELKQGAIHKLIVKEDFEPAGAEKSTYDHLFSEPPSPAIRELPIPAQ